MKTLFHNVLRPTTLAASALLVGGLLPAANLHAADPYDKSLESRVEALERELNIMESDSKGKNIQTGTDVPTFVRASKNVQELVFSGEVRFRYELGESGAQANNPRNPANGNLDNPEGTESRNRFRFRLFADYKLNDNFFAGAAVQTAPGADSGNTTFSEGFDNYSLYLWRFFVGWHSKDDNLKFIVGKQPNPFYLETEMLWDADISPTGVTEQFKVPISPQFDIGLVAGQFIFYDNNENAFYNNNRLLANGQPNPAYVSGGDFNNDAYLTYQQIVATFKPSNKLSVTAAPGYLFYVGHGGTNSGAATSPIPTTVGSGNAVGQNANVLLNTAAFNSGNATRNLSIATLSTDAKVDLGALKVKVYGDGVYNFQGGARVVDEYGLPGLDNETNKFGFATGVTVGSDYQIKKKGDYVLLAEYRQVGLGSVDPNLNDSDFNYSRLGFRGIKAAASYGFYPWLIASVTYYDCFNLGTDKNVNIGVANINTSQTVQFDLTAKF